jgi:GTP-binding protein
VGRSNVGKSTLINALTRLRLARTSAAPGKTRLANIYRVQRGSSPPLYLVDLPGYGYARGGDGSAREFADLTRAYFGQEGRDVAALLLVDARHPGLASDLAAWHWLKETVADAAVVATKIDKLARGERIRAMRELESVLEHSVLPVSAVTGEGLDELWKWMDRQANNPQPPRRSPLSRSSRPPKGTAQPRPGETKSRPRR